MTDLSRFRINSTKVIQETIEGETLMVNLDSGNYYSLDNIGAEIWGLIENKIGVNEIIDDIARRYTGERAEIERAVLGLINELLQEALIVENGEAAPAEEAEPCGGTRAEKGSPSFEAPGLHKYTDMQDLLLLDPIHDVDEAGWPSSKNDLPAGSK
jgi:hypothetical protein